MIYQRIIIFLSLILLLSGCGFHLQGQTYFAPALQHLYLQTQDPYGYLATDLRQILKSSGIELADSPDKATMILTILQDTNAQILIAPSGTNQTQQYQLQSTISYTLSNKGRTLLGPEALTEQRPITIQSNQILGTSNEADLFYRQMHRALAYALINRISSRAVTRLMENPPPLSTTTKLEMAQ